MHPTVRLRLLPLLALPGLLVLPAASQAAARVASLRCVPYVRGLKADYVPIGGRGFTPNANRGVHLTWSDGATAGDAKTNAVGGFYSLFRGPKRLSSSKVGFQKTYTLTATDLAHGAIVAHTKVVFVHAGLRTAPLRTSPHGLRTYKFYGFPAHKNIYAHYVFGGTLRRTKFVGNAKGACGKLRHRMPLIPYDTKVRLGNWSVYFSNSKTFSSKSFLLVQPFTIYSTRF